MFEQGPNNNESGLMAGVQEALDSGKVGFEEISVEAVAQLFEQAPEGQVFMVPDERHAAVYAERAAAVDRSDLKFEVGE